MSFDRLAPHYDWLEALTAGGLLQRARTTWLENLGDRTQILSVGEGHGRFAEACTKRFPDIPLTCVEASEQMLQRAKRRVAASQSNLTWIQSNIFTWSPDKQYDAIVTCFFLDCFTPDMLTEVIAKLAGCASPGATWLVVDFAVPESGFARWRAKAVHALMYNFFRIATSLPARWQTPPDNLLRAHGFRLEGRREFECGLIRADLWRGSLAE